jgi:hypothetical protein
MVLGDYAPSGNAFVYFKTKTDRNTDKLCGTVSQKNTAFVQPLGLIAISNDASVSINTGKECVTPENPVYACTDVKIDQLGGRKIRATVVYNGAPANRVVLKNFEYNFGDGSTPLVTTNNPVEYTYAKDGTYKVTVKITFAVDGVNKTVSSDACSEAVTFTTPPTTPTTPTTPTPPKELPYTGAGSNIALFLATTMVGMGIFRAIALKKQ